MTDEQLSEKISKSATKLVVRKYPFIMSGEFVGTFEPTHSYRDYFKEQEKSKKTGIRTILWVNPEIFFDLYHTDIRTYNIIMDGRMNFTIRYLSNLYDRNTSEEKELESLDLDILRIFYDTGNIMDGKKQLGLLDFFVRYAFMGSTIGEWSGFYDFDTAVPPPGIK